MLVHSGGGPSFYGMWSRINVLYKKKKTMTHSDYFTGERQVLRTHGQANYLLTEQLLDGERIYRISCLGEYLKYLEVVVSNSLSELICIVD